MNLEDVLDPEYGLQQDDYSLSGVAFGDEGQLQVVGWSGKQGAIKMYVVKCIKCSQDVELFGGGYFKSQKISISKGKLVCGCGKNPRWSKEQYLILCSRKVKELGYTFLGFTGEWQRVKTKILLSCEKHGVWGSGTITTLINIGTGCPACGATARVKSDDEWIKSFIDSGSFPIGTKFWRSERLNHIGRKEYWFVLCPECGETGTSLNCNLQRGRVPCSCGVHRQQECYINWILDSDNRVAIKFGIARDSKQRIKQQNSKCAYEVQQYQVYKFLDVASCKKAERECKKELECGILLKRDMPDGYSETTWVYNLSKIQDIYKRNGGELI